jgi:predicted nucleotidyltransferase
MMRLKISREVRKELEALVEGLKRELGNTLEAVVVHGSAARADWGEGSNVDLIVVLREAKRARLEAMGNLLQVARYAARIEAMIVVHDEIAPAADVFPLLYRDVKRHHVVLHGEDPFARLDVAERHLRLRIEQELREVQIRLRRVATDSRGSVPALKRAVDRKLKQVRPTLHALLELKNVACDDDLPAVLAEAAKHYDVGLERLRDVDGDPQKAYDALAALLRAAIADVDTMEVEPS